MKQKYLFIRIIILGLFFISTNSFAQKTVIRILDEQTSEPCPFANVVLYDKNNNYLEGTVSNDNGDVTFEINERSKIIISYVGYKTFTDYITPGENRTIHLQPSYLEMEEVVVTGQFQPRKADQSIYKIDVINSKTILERGVTNLAEALSNETSIRLSGDESTGKSVVLQGLGGENVKYLIDGVPIVGRVRGNIDLSQINMENVDHIEIVQGPMSVVYGTSALAGVINIITKQNTKNKNTIKVNSYTDNKSNYNVGLYSSIIRGKHSVTLSANRDMFQGIDINLDPDTAAHIDTAYGYGNDRYMEFKPKKVLNADLEYAYRNEHFQMRVKTQYMNLLLKQYSNPTPDGKAFDFDYITTRSANSISISDKITNSLSYNVIGAYTYFGRTSESITSNLVSLEKVVTGSTSTTFQNGMTRGNFTYAKEESTLSYQFGWDINYDIGEGDKMEKGAEMGNFAAFLSAQYLPFKQLSIQPGFRYIYNTVYGAPLIPSINLQLTIFKGLNFRASYAKGFRAPSLKELYLDFKDVNHNVTGNKDLKAEKTNSYNASISYKLGKDKQLFKIEPSFFYNDGKDAIVIFVTDQETNSATNRNLGGRRTQGANINLSYMHFGGLTLGAGFSITGETYMDSIGVYDPIVYYNNYSFNVKYNWRKYETIFMANLKYYGETPSLDEDDNTSELYRVYTDDYGDLEVTVTKLFWNKRLTVVLGGKNLMDNYSKRTYGYKNEDYDELISPINYGRTFFLKLNLKLYN